MILIETTFASNQGEKGFLCVKEAISRKEAQRQLNREILDKNRIYPQKESLIILGRVISETTDLGI